MHWMTIVRRVVGVALIIPVLYLVYKPMVEVLRGATPNNWLIVATIMVYVALCLWGLLAWRRRAKK